MAEKTLMKGNEALAEGAVRAGCRFFAGYPITPQNEIPEYMSWRLPEMGGTFIQAESEVAAINMLFGASACGARVMTSSSGPGISLKQEGISYCAGARLPIFYANVVRGGPGLGNIAPSQGDYYQATRGGGHGDYRVFVMAPGSVSEMANFPRKCYEVAFKYRIPSMILADGLLGQMMEPLEFDFEPVDTSTIPEPDWVLGVNEGRKRRVVRSYDLAPGKMEEFNLELDSIHSEVKANEVICETIETDDAELVLTGYGTSARVCKSAMALARKEGIKVGVIRPITIWPFPEKIFSEIADKVKNFLVVEMSLGQYIDDVKLSILGKAKIDLHKRPAGGIPVAEEILGVIKQILGKS
ncbi:MAG: 3-methyl-2-oxobutanoate dehydrogenase subunit VorB [candidate division Zixibacteria bacterium 4484_95]|nr:MAG: 3-methyl-2-oxobutanoate dehydrogenase subunit VorB [candidate division Zixibacteria bacterium 4484_95]RKX17438.1 MAG: 3-methyl-2-oxobutanoate dehydrogenase subunit beta [candidate division Zixibacteria bacterium]